MYCVKIPPKEKSAIGMPAFARRAKASSKYSGIFIFKILKEKPKIIPIVKALDIIDLIIFLIAGIIFVLFCYKV